MPLFAFDGTWNLDRPGTEQDTNVVWFHDAYTAHKHYFKGIGTRFGIAGRLAGGIFGAGGRERVGDAVKAYEADLRDGDTTPVDIVGFSRGSALALAFANKICDKGHDVRFLGLWDCVPSFGIAAIPINIGWDLDLPDNVHTCFHAMSLDERRLDFRLHRPDARVANADQEGRLFEVWFRGVHSDIGGGNNSPGLSSIALNWMFVKAGKCGVPIDPVLVTGNSARVNPLSNISTHGFGAIDGRDRTVRWNDVVHGSVSFRPTDSMTHHNNPPANLIVVDDDGNQTGHFQGGVPVGAGGGVMPLR